MPSDKLPPVSPAAPLSVTPDFTEEVRTSYQRITDLDADVSGLPALYDRMDEAEDDIDNLETRMTAAEGDITTLQAMGVQEVYNNDPTFTRTGVALTAVTPVATSWVTNRPSDPFQSSFKARFADYSAGAAVAGYGGDIPYVSFPSQRHSADTDEHTAPGYMAATSTALIPRDIRATTLDAGTTRTYIQAGMAATLNPSGAPGTNRIRVAGPYYFSVGGATAIRPGYDVILVTYGDATSQAYRITGFVDSVTVTATTLSGANPSWTSNTPATIQWFSFAHSHGELGDARAVATYVTPANLSSATAVSTPIALKVGGRKRDIDDVTTEWGYFDESASGAWTPTIRINSLGSINSTGINPFNPYDTGIIQHTFAHRTSHHSPSTDATITVDPENEGGGSTGHGSSSFYIQTSASPSSAAPQVITIAGDESVLPQGFICEFIVENVTGVAFTMVWPAWFKFSDVSDKQPGVLNGTANAIFRWRGIHGHSNMLMERLPDYAP